MSSADGAQDGDALRMSAHAAWADCAAQLLSGLGASAPLTAQWMQGVAAEPRVQWLRTLYGLSDFELSAVTLATAAELEPAGWAAHGPPLTVNRCLDLLCISRAERVARREAFSADAPLLRHRLVRLATRADALGQCLLMTDPQIIRTLLYGEGLDPRLVPYCRLQEPAPEAALPGSAPPGIGTIVGQAWRDRTALLLQFRGPPGSGRHRAAEALAALAGARILAANLELLPRQVPGDWQILLREAWLQQAILVVDGLELATGEPMPADHRCLLGELAADGGVAIVCTPVDATLPVREGADMLRVEFGTLDRSSARDAWRTELDRRGYEIEDSDIETLAGRLRLTPGQIASAVAAAGLKRDLRRARNAAPAACELADYLDAAREQSRARLTPLGRHVEGSSRWEDLVVPAGAARQLREMCARVVHRTCVLESWGFGRKLTLGKGTSALFAGPSGTGKTMAAEVVAREIGLDLFKIDLATVVSKYIGETEKNLDRIFGAARDANAILLFDEADAIFGKRSEVHDAHDRYANLEIAYLLQKMEEYDGLAILSTNLKQNLDDAFIRRLTYTVLFPFPDGADRLQIWTRIWPAGVPLADGISFEPIANRFRLSGGSIKNAALTAAYLAAADGGSVNLGHVVHAVRHEFHKLGKPLGEEQWADLAAGVHV